MAKNPKALGAFPEFPALLADKDPEVRALAQKVIAAQEAEMKEMQAWLDKKGMQVEKPRTAADHSAMGH